jgi:hypothetical protein
MCWSLINFIYNGWTIEQYIFVFNDHGSVHLGNVYIRLKVQQDAHGFVYVLYVTIFALHVSGAI